MNMLRYTPRGLALRLLLAFCVLTSTLVITGCPSESQLDRAAKASFNIAHYTGEAITLTTTLYTSGVIKIDVKDKLAKQFEDLSKSGKAFNDLLVKYNEMYKAGNVPPAIWSQLITSFDEVTAPFIQLLSLIPQAAGLKDSKAFRIISAAVVVIAKLLMENGVNVPKYQLLNEKVKAYGLA